MEMCNARSSELSCAHSDETINIPVLLLVDTVASTDS